MSLCYSNFKSFRNKSSRIFWFEQLLFSKVDKLTCKGQVGLGLAGKGRWRANTGWNQLCGVIGNSHATSIKIWACPSKTWQPYCTQMQMIWVYLSVYVSIIYTYLSYIYLTIKKSSNIEAILLINVFEIFWEGYPLRCLFQTKYTYCKVWFSWSKMSCKISKVLSEMFRH